MKEQEYYIDNIKDFDMEQICESGQCFRWNREIDGSYTGVVKNNVIHVIQHGKQVIFKGYGEDNFKELIRDYFDFNTDYTLIKKTLSKVDTYLATSIQYGNGIRILNQDVWECLISFIISANNNIPRIKKIIENLAKTYGRPLPYKKNTYYTFPTPQALATASVEELRALGTGFRDKRIYETTQDILKKKVDLEQLIKEKDSNKVRETLMTLSGVGEKVADCIMLFSLKRYEIFPIDVWIARVINELYLKQEETKINKQEIQRLAQEKYKNLAGIAQQYLFYWRRSA